MRFVIWYAMTGLIAFMLLMLYIWKTDPEGFKDDEFFGKTHNFSYYCGVLTAVILFTPATVVVDLMILYHMIFP